MEASVKEKEIGDDTVSMATVSDELHNIKLRQEMIARVSRTDAYFKDQHKDSPDLTLAEKSDIASAVLDRNPATFLFRYSKYLVEEDLEYFGNQKGNYEINFYLKQISERLNSSKQKVTVKNRRYEAMKSLLEGGEYFSDSEMKWRDPYLYEQMIGQYLTEQERQAEIDKTDLSFSNILMKHLYQQEENMLYRRLREVEEGQEEEGDSDDEEEEGSEEGMQQDASLYAEEETKQPEISEHEKQLLREEFVQIMQERFISGQDKQFDYTTVDGNNEYDSLKIREQDEEERYFDEEDEDSMEAETADDRPHGADTQADTSMGNDAVNE